MTYCNPTLILLQLGLKLQKDMQSPLVNCHFYYNLMGKLLFLTKTCLDITYAINLLPLLMNAPQEAYFKGAK